MDDVYFAHIGSCPNTTISHTGRSMRVTFGIPVSVLIEQEKIEIHHRKLYLSLTDSDLDMLYKVQATLMRYLNIMDNSGKLYFKRTILNNFIDMDLEYKSPRWVINVPRRIHLAPGIIHINIIGLDVIYEEEGPQAYVVTTISPSSLV